jgi:BrnA antitoxin of type II toxin-antitoxin system
MAARSAVAPRVHVGFRLAADVVASIKASGRGYNARVEQALREAGFGAKAKAKIAKAAAKKRSAARPEAKRAAGKRRA